MTRAQLAILPVPDGRKAERRVVNLAARLREAGASLVDIDVLNLSTDGFMARGVSLEVGAYAWLKIAGLEPQASRVIWNEDGKAGFEFVNALHGATVELLVLNNRKPVPKNHFGPLGRRGPSQFRKDLAGSGRHRQAGPNRRREPGTQKRDSPTAARRTGQPLHRPDRCRRRNEAGRCAQLRRFDSTPGAMRPIVRVRARGG